MDALKQLNLALWYIEEHLAEDIDYEKVSGIACCTEYHFRRMFSFLSGFSLGEYVRMRRLDRAAAELRINGATITDIALKYGYNSPDAFSRAFLAFHGSTPAEVRRHGAVVKAFPPMAFQLTVRGGQEMHYRIVEKEAFQIAGVKKRITLIYEGVNPQMNALWAKLREEDFVQLKELCNTEPKGILCVSVNFTQGREEGTQLDQYIGVATTLDIPGRWEVLPVSAATWAVFTAVGPFPKALQDTWARIYAEWFPTSGYQMTGGPELLWNESRDTSLPNYKSELWIPVTQA